jgi:putative aldouronate transport system substrate-binding protein
MKQLNRREMLKMMGVTSVGLALAACAPAAPGAAPAEGGAAASQETVKITMIESWFGVPQFSESIDPVTQAISKKMQDEGLNIEIQSLILADHNAKYPALYASGSDFTMAFDAPWNKMNSLRDQGALLPIEGLIDTHGATLKEAITEKIYNANFTNEHLYGIPTAYYYGGTGGAIYREDLRQEWGADAPTSEGGWPSLESFLAAVVKNAPELIPFVSVATQSVTSYAGARRALNPGVTKTGVIIPDPMVDWQLIDEEEYAPMVEGAELLRSWWEQGFINKTDVPFSGQSQNSQVDYIYPGRGAACVENEPEYKQIDQTKQMKSSNPDASLAGVDLTGMRAGKFKGRGSLKQWNFIVFNVNAPTEQQEAGIKYFNWLTSSQDNMDLWLMGIDGVNYKKEDNLKFSEIEGVDAARNYRRQWYVSGVSGRFQRQPADLPKEAEEALAFFTTESNWDFNPYEGFEADTKALELDSAKLNGIYDEATHGFNSGQEPTPDAIQKMKKMLDEAGRQEYKAKLQKQLDDYIAAHKA